MIHLLLTLVVSFHLFLKAEEGMWPFNNIPLAQIEKKYGLTLDPSWLQGVQLSCVRISAGGSGVFISPSGLIMTNHHVGAHAIYTLSSEENNLIEEGFLASCLEKELKCPNLYVDILVSMQDVTEELNKDLPLKTSLEEKEKSRKEKMAALKKKALEKTSLQPEIVSLYQGARYHLYLYKRLSDIRLVMAPEKSIAFLGGNERNFEYPRYNFDVCFFRAYENEKPFSSNHYLKWSLEGPQEGEPLFVAGHPGRTQRMLTSDHLVYFRDKKIPLLLSYLKSRIEALEKFSAQSQENRRVAEQDLFSYYNIQKAYTGIYQGLQQEDLIERKKAYEKELYGNENSSSFQVWLKLKKALENQQSNIAPYLFLEGSFSIYSKLFAWAKTVVRAHEEKNKPNEKRLQEYTDSELASLEQDLFSTEPTYLGLEVLLMENSLKQLSKHLGEKNPAAILALESCSPEERAKDLIYNSSLGDRNYRKSLYENRELFEASKDPLILLARELDPYARLARKKYEEELEPVQKESYTQIAALIFKKYGETVYPDATFTLRLSIGSMKGYLEHNLPIDPMTKIKGIFELADRFSPLPTYMLPFSWKKEGHLLDPETPFNFVSTHDIVGGNSGSPVINAKKEVVGLIFDGNIHSLIWDYGFSETQGRAVSVHSRGIIEALQKIYKAEALFQEILELNKL